MHLDFGRGHVNTRRHDTWGNKFQFDTGIPAALPLSRPMHFHHLAPVAHCTAAFVYVWYAYIIFLFRWKHLQTQIKSLLTSAYFATKLSGWETDRQTDWVEKCLIRMEKRLSTKQCMLASIMMNEKCLFDWKERKKKITLNIIKSTRAECIRRLGFLMQQLNERMLPCEKTRFYAAYRGRARRTHKHTH